MRILISGGGSAGHIWPALAVAGALRELDSSVELLYVGQAQGMEARIVAGAGLPFAAISAGKFRRNHFDSGLKKVLNASTLGPNTRDAFRTARGVAGAVKVLRLFKPDAVFVKGGYVGLPVGVAARLLRVPLVIHESDLEPGLTNRILSRWADKIGVGFPVKYYHQFDQKRLVFTGNPVRPEVTRGHRLEALGGLGLEENIPVVYVTGGSQGAARINSAVLKALPELLRVCQVVHQTGEGEIERVRFELKRLGKLERGKRYHPYAFLTKELPGVLAAADLVVGRAGVGTIAELALLEKPTILIPNTEMAGHQVENARLLARSGAVRMLDDRTLTPEGLVAEVRKVLNSPEEQAMLAKGIGRFAKPEATQLLAEMILAAARGAHAHADKDGNDA